MRQPLTNTCICGRKTSHCLACGSPNVYRKKFESDFKTQQIGQPVDVYTCRTCGCKSDTSMTCQAVPESSSSVYPPKVQPNVQRPQDTLDPSSDEYSQALQNRFAEIIARKGMDESKTVSVMRLEGWRIELDRGDKPTPNGESQDADEPVNNTPMTLEDIIHSFTKPKPKGDRQ